MVRCHKVVDNVLTVCMLSGLRASSIFVKGSANLVSFHITLKAQQESFYYSWVWGKKSQAVDSAPSTLLFLGNLSENAQIHSSLFLYIKGRQGSPGKLTMSGWKSWFNSGILNQCVSFFLIFFFPSILPCFFPSFSACLFLSFT